MAQRHTLRLVAVSLLCIVAAVCGADIALRAFSQETIRTDLADVTTSTRLSREGHMELRVPVVDWGVRSDAHGLPLAVKAEVARIDRDGARTAIGPDPGAPKRTLAQVKRDGEKVIRETITRAVICILAGSLAGGLLIGGLWGSISRRRSPLIVGIICGLLFPLSFTPAFLSAVHDIRSKGTSDIEFTGQGQEVGRVVGFAEQLLHVGDDYSALYSRALGSARNITQFVQGRPTGQGKRKEILVASDLHDNVLVMDAFDEFAGKRTVFMPGDFGQVGARVEERLAGRIAGLGSQVVAVSGNHDSRAFMTALAGEGALVLTSEGTLQADGSVDVSQKVVSIEGMRVAGYSDPLERGAPGGGNPDHVLRVHGAQYERQVTDLIAWFDALEERPDVLMIHQHGLAHRLLAHLRSRGDTKPLLILTGHDHIAHVHELDSQVIVDGGSLGAGGPFAVGEQSSSFALVGIADARARSAALVSVDPLTSAAGVKQVQLTGQGEREWRAEEAVELAAGTPPAHADHLD
jgi:predicted phosphodiesterase